MSANVLPRLLRLLDLLSGRDLVPGPELADAVGVDARTLRRDVDRLRDLGHPVEAVRGRHGGYRLARTRRLPPLVLDDRQAVTVVLGVDAARRAGLDAEDGEALADRLVSLLPEEVAYRVTALRASLAGEASGPWSGRVSATRLLDLGVAVRDGRSLRMRYVDRRGRTTERTLDPWGVVQHGARWYVVGHDHRADDVRLFRVDRIAGVLLGGPASVHAPPGFDLPAHVAEQLVHTAWSHAVEVELHTDLDDARTRVPTGAGEVVEESGRVLLRVGADDLDGMARVVASLGVPVTVHQPDALRASLAALSEQLAASATRRP